jgi:hypothetical protein
MSAESAEKAEGPDDSGPMKVEDPGTEARFEAAARGDRLALSELYGQASAWLAADQTPPPQLRAWLVDVLRDLHAVARAGVDKDESEDQVNKWLRIATRFKRGRGRPASRRSELQERSVAADVFHALTFDGATSLEDARARVAEYQRRLGLPPCSDDQIKAAWAKHRKEFPELHRRTSKK